METQPAARAEVGSLAPDFELTSTGGEKLRLSTFRGTRNVLLLFYPADFSPVCSNQLPEVEQHKPMLDALSTEILGISVDGRWAHEAFARQLGLTFALLADVHREACRLYGVLREADSFSERALFVIDKKGILRYCHVSEIREIPDLDDAIRVLQSLS